MSITIKSCPVCEGKTFKLKFICKDHSVSSEEFKIVSCETCGFVLTSPRPDQKNIGRYYNSKNYISHTNNKKGLFNLLYQTIRKYTIERKVSMIKKFAAKNLLDIGCGTGEFLNKAKIKGINVEGIEPSEKARIQCKQNHNLNIKESADLGAYNDHKFDCITMWHVLEHMPQLNRLIESIYAKTSRNAKIIVGVPNHNSWDAKYYKKHWAAWDVPVHFWHFTKESIEKLFKKHGFVLLKTKPMIFDSFYVSILSEEYKNGKKKFVKGFLIGLMSNLVGFFTKAGFSSTIYVFEKKHRF
tara:strand:+ start:17049 stop:17942 length:894 start_codon:yes stop_codon:yes gene_type:complete